MKKATFSLFFTLLTSSSFCSSLSYDCFAPPLKQSTFDDRALLFANHNNSFLAEKIANYLGISLATTTITTDEKGEIRVDLEENVRNKNVLVLPTYQQSNTYLNDHLFELYLFVRATKRASASSITAIIPYYEHHNRYLRSFPISSTDISLLLEVAGVDRVITLDLHSGYVQGFSRNTKADNSYTTSLFVPYFINKELENVIVAPIDAEEEEKARKFAEGLQQYGIAAEILTVNQEMSRIDNIKGSDVILINEIGGTAHNLVERASLLQQQGAKRVFAVVIHPIFTDEGLEMIGKSSIEEIVIANTLPVKETLPSNVRFVPVQPMLSSIITKGLIDDSLLNWTP